MVLTILYVRLCSTYPALVRLLKTRVAIFCTFLEEEQEMLSLLFPVRHQSVYCLPFLCESGIQPAPLQLLLENASPFLRVFSVRQKLLSAISLSTKCDFFCVSQRGSSVSFNRNTLECGINVPARLLIFMLFSKRHTLIL